MPSRRDLWIAIGSVFFCAAPWASWLMFFRHRRDRAFQGLAVLDTLVAAAFCVLLAGPTVITPPVPANGPRIGVALDPGRSEAAVVSVVPAGPAAEAGIAPGDVIAEVDGRAVTRLTLPSVIALGHSPAERTLGVRRDGALRSVRVIPRTGLPRPPPVPRRAVGLTDLAAPAITSLLELLVCGALAILARRRGAPARTPLVLVLVLALASAISTIGTLAGEARGGLAAWLGVLIGSLFLLGAGIVLRRRDREPAAHGYAATVGLGIVAILAFAIRVAVILATMPSLVRTGLSEGGSWNPANVAVLAVAAVGIAPVAEELLFRGFLLPWLRSFTSAPVAIALSALVFAVGHAHYEAGMLVVFVYGAVLGWARLRTGSLRASMTLHALVNAAVLGAALYRA